MRKLWLSLIQLQLQKVYVATFCTRSLTRSRYPSSSIHERFHGSFPRLLQPRETRGATLQLDLRPRDRRPHRRRRFPPLVHFSSFDVRSMVPANVLSEERCARDAVLVRSFKRVKSKRKKREEEEEEEMKGKDGRGDGSSVKFRCYFRFGDAQRTKWLLENSCRGDNQKW